MEEQKREEMREVVNIKMMAMALLVLLVVITMMITSSMYYCHYLPVQPVVVRITPSTMTIKFFFFFF